MIGSSKPLINKGRGVPRYGPRIARLFIVKSQSVNVISLNKGLTGKSILAVLVLMTTPRLALAQSGEDSWDRLRQLHAGQKIEVVNMKLKSVTGNFTGYDDHAVLLRVDRDEVSIPRGDVLSIKNREISHRRRNVLLGLAIGAAGGLAIGAIKGATYHESGETGVFMAVCTPIGAGIGAGLGAALPAGAVTVYRARAKERPAQIERAR